ncbi:MAG: hypothetical protein K2X27_13680 [Candidatus Obscuribacterales bacterium]|nr:hypothetical protein [Candidatus Obscuribacterales bacterium]
MGYPGAVSLLDGYKATYIATSDYQTLAASCTDFFQMFWNSKTVRILEIYVSMKDTGASQTFNTISLYKRTAGNSVAGTSSTFGNITKMDSGNAANDASPKIFSANPTVGAGTMITTVTLPSYTTGFTGTVSNSPGDFCIFKANNMAQALVLKASNEGVALSLGGSTQAGSSPKTRVTVVWTEE